MNFASKIKQLVKDAPVATGGTNVNFGAMDVTPMVITFHGRGVQPDKRTLAEFAEEQGVDVDAVELGENDQLQLHFRIHVQELNPSLSFEFVERDIAVLQSGPKQKTDWQEIVEPALVKVFGDNWADVLIGKNGKAPKPVYVAAEQVDSLRAPKPNPDGTPGKNYGVPKVIQKFDSRKECEEARDERYGAPKEKEDMGDDIEDEVEGDEEGEDEVTYEFPDKVTRQVWALYKGNRKNEKTVLTFIGKNQAWKAHNAKDLLAEAIARGEAGDFDE